MGRHVYSGGRWRRDLKRLACGPYIGRCEAIIAPNIGDAMIPPEVLEWK